MIIQVLITAAFILGFLKLSDKENVIDYFGASAIYLVPLVIVSVADFAISHFKLPPLLHVVTFSAFFVVPYLIISAIYEGYSTKRKALLSLGVFSIVLVVQVALFAINYTTTSSVS